jgi:hypothetical protein
VSNPFKTPEFKALFEKWNGILEKNGHKEIENFSLPDAPLKTWHNLKWKNLDPNKVSDIQKYYEEAFELLKTYVFKTETHRRIWELHCEGVSVRMISRIINRRKFTKTRVNVFILSVERSSGLKRE